MIVDSERPAALSGDVTKYFEYKDLDLYTYEASFVDSTSVRDHALVVDFSDLTQGLTHANTGGYLVDVYRNGESRQITLKGVKATKFRVFLGPTDSTDSVSYSIYRFDANFVLQATGEPGD